MRAFLTLLSIWMVGVVTPGHAQTGPWDDSFEFSKVRLVAAKQTLDGSDQVQLGLEFDVAEGWNIYWRSPGPVGLPPTLIWTDLTNIANSQVEWPVPARYTYKIPGEEGGMESMIYRGNTILPITVDLADPNQPLFARGVVEYMVCQDQCIFGEANVAIDLFVGDRDAPLSMHAPRINQFKSQVPLVSDTFVGLGLASHSYDAVGQVLRFDLRSPVAMTAPDVYVEAPDNEAGFVFGHPEITVSDDGLGAQITVPVEEVAYSGATPGDVDLRLTLVDGQRGVDLGFVRIGTAQGISATAQEIVPIGFRNQGLGASAGGFGPEGWSLWFLVIAAVLAGFILNLMPCVFPVLSLKLMAFVGKADKGNAEIRYGFLATAAGIIFSFLILAGVIVALQSAGVAVGWGFQFQSPWFVSTMIAIMVVFAANMFGWFELPSIPGLGAVGVGRAGPMADFMTGALATLLATPCSAPLLAPVIGVAFAGSAATIFGLFLLIGIGMAAPYWAVVLFPTLARMMPRPGPWMMMLKVVLGLALLAFAAFMLWVLMTQLGAWVAGLGLVLSLAVLALLYARKSRPSALAPSIAAFAALTLVPVASASFLPNQQLAWFSSGGDDGIQWQPFDEAAIADLVADGNSVFVDVTASWCVNCKFNKAIALETKAVRQAFEQQGVVAMVADWTNHDPAIGVYLAKFGRAGIPFNIVYSPANPSGHILPTALTQEIVLSALDSSRF